MSKEWRRNGWRACEQLSEFEASDFVALREFLKAWLFPHDHLYMEALKELREHEEARGVGEIFSCSSEKGKGEGSPSKR